MRPRTKALFNDAEIEQLKVYGFGPRKGQYLCAFAKDCYEIYPYLLGNKRLYSLAYNNRRVYGPVPNLVRVLEEYCLRAADFEVWTGVPRQISPFGRRGRKVADRGPVALRTAQTIKSANTAAIAGGELVA